MACRLGLDEIEDALSAREQRGRRHARGQRGAEHGVVRRQRRADGRQVAARRAAVELRDAAVVAGVGPQQQRRDRPVDARGRQLLGDELVDGDLDDALAVIAVALAGQAVGGAVAVVRVFAGHPLDENEVRFHRRQRLRHRAPGVDALAGDSGRRPQRRLRAHAAEQQHPLRLAGGGLSGPAHRHVDERGEQQPRAHAACEVSAAQPAHGVRLLGLIGPSHAG